MPVVLIIAYRNLVQARWRSALLGLAIALVTALLVLLMSLSRGISENLISAATTVSAGHLVVAGWYKPTAGASAPIMTGASGVREVVERSTPGLDYMVERHRGWGKLISETGSVQVGISGLIPEEESRFFERIDLALESEYVEGGRAEVFGDPRDLAQKDTILIFAEQARRLGVRVGDMVTYKTETLAGQTNTRDLRVVGVASDLGLLSSWAVYAPKQVVLDLYQLNADTTGALWVYLDDIEEASQVMEVLRGSLTQAGYTVRDHEPLPFFFKFETVAGEDWTGQQLDLTIWKDEVSFLNWILVGFDTVSWFLVTVLVAIIAVGIMNAMWAAVRDRTREIGTMRAIGASRASVLVMFMAEAAMLGGFATTFGAICGAGVALAVDAARLEVSVEAVQTILLARILHLAVSPAAVLAAIVFLSSLTAIAALWPSVRAARMPPVQALNATE